MKVRAITSPQGLIVAARPGWGWAFMMSAGAAPPPPGVAGSGAGSLVAYAANRRKSLSEIYLPPLAEDPVASKGYMGHDEFRVVESTLVRRFPVYREGDTNAQPTGGTRQVQYKLKAGEAGWILRPDRVVQY